MQTTQQQVMR